MYQFSTGNVNFQELPSAGGSLPQTP